ncbi:PH domain-containing protein [uncultured Pseudokineococcus sp.]|uniref:PH domain-containing protein n=1 Tax=uncultured Pseudokineococcus sp. TaxID=1642928 RepID=UPI00262A1034|nr:PH domain-containing protein [uncultured Pseudokineococcus sp.]
MTEPADEEAAPPLLVDVGGLPQRFQDPQQQVGRRWLQALVVIGGAALLVSFVLDLSASFPKVLGAMWLLQGGLGLLVAARVHVRLEPEGVRRVGLVGRGSVVPWSAVAEVRPPDTFHPASHLRGPGGRFAETTDLPGLSADDARELGRRLDEARAHAQEGA